MIITLCGHIFSVVLAMIAARYTDIGFGTVIEAVLSGLTSV